MTMINRTCKCPYVLCSVHGNCQACVAKNMLEGDICYCMENNAIVRGAKLPVNPPKTEIYDTEYEMSARCADIVKRTLSEKPDALLCFPAGTSVEGTCKILVEMQKKGEIDFSKARFVSLDEWLDLDDETENCTHFLKRRLYDPLGIRENQLHLFNTHAVDMNEECKRIDQYIFDNGPIDLMLLGIGMNGHLGLNEPGEDFNDFSKVVQLSETTKSVGQKYFQHGKVLTRGITLGIHHIFNTKKVILQVTGKHKQDIMYKLYTTRPTEDLPASALDLMEGAVVIADKAAAGRIIDIVNAK